MSTRSRSPSFSSTFSRWRSTVFGLIISTSPISREVRPSAISFTTSVSRGESGSKGPPASRVRSRWLRMSALTAAG